MSREFDSFILIPSLAVGEVDFYDNYLGKDSSLFPEMALLYIDGTSASFVHDATEAEVATIELLEDPSTPVYRHIQDALNVQHPGSLLNENTFLDSVSVLPNKKGETHLLKYKFIKNGELIELFGYGVDFQTNELEDKL